ncbi:hypothetical protein CRG98_040999, partial [Punica granatum]
NLTLLRKNLHTILFWLFSCLSFLLLSLLISLPTDRTTEIFFSLHVIRGQKKAAFVTYVCRPQY